MDVDSTVDSGLELMKHISNDEAIQLKDKLDSLQRRYRDLVSRGADLLKTAQVSYNTIIDSFTPTYTGGSRITIWGCWSLKNYLFFTV